MFTGFLILINTKCNSQTGKAKGFTRETQELNHYIDIIKNMIYGIHRRLVNENKIVSAVKLRNLYIGKEEDQKMLLKIFQDHNDQVEKLIGKDFAPGTVERYRTAKKHVAEYIKL